MCPFSNLFHVIVEALKGNGRVELFFYFSRSELELNEKLLLRYFPWLHILHTSEVPLIPSVREDRLIKTTKIRTILL